MKFGVIGHGFMGSRHVAIIDSFEECECIAACDTDPFRLKGLDKKIICYEDIDLFLENPSIDVVVIATPNKWHKEHALKAINAGKHVICEKPIALSVDELDEMKEAADRMNVTLTSHHQRRLDQDFQAIKEAYEREMLGNVYLIKSVLYGYNGYTHSWHVYKSEGGGMLYNWGVHLIDQILYMVSSPLKTVYADIRNIINIEVDDYFKIILKFENMVTAEIELGTYMLSDKEGWFPRHWYMFGNKGSMYIDGFIPEGRILRTTQLLAETLDEEGRYCGPTRSFGIPEKGVVYTQAIPYVKTETREFYANYIRAIQGKEPFLVKLPELRYVLKVMDAAIKSSESMSSVAF